MLQTLEVFLRKYVFHPIFNTMYSKIYGTFLSTLFFFRLNLL
jgi:hypothetical protein